MPGRDITRLRNRAAKVLLLGFVIWAAPQMALLAWPQTASPQNDSLPVTPPSAAAAPAPVAPPQKQDEKKDGQEKKDDQGVFVFRKDVDEVLLHPSVIDDKQHIVTTLHRRAFPRFQHG